MSNAVFKNLNNHCHLIFHTHVQYSFQTKQSEISGYKNKSDQLQVTTHQCTFEYPSRANLCSSCNFGLYRQFTITKACEVKRVLLLIGPAFLLMEKYFESRLKSPATLLEKLQLKTRIYPSLLNTQRFTGLVLNLICHSIHKGKTK